MNKGEKEICNCKYKPHQFVFVDDVYNPACPKCHGKMLSRDVKIYDQEILEKEYIKLKTAWIKLYTEWLKLSEIEKQMYRLPNEPQIVEGKIVL